MLRQVCQTGCAALVQVKRLCSDLPNWACKVCTDQETCVETHHEQLKRNTSITMENMCKFWGNPLFQAAKQQLNSDKLKCSYLVQTLPNTGGTEYTTLISGEVHFHVSPFICCFVTFKKRGQACNILYRSKGSVETCQTGCVT